MPKLKLNFLQGGRSNELSGLFTNTGIRPKLKWKGAQSTHMNVLFIKGFIHCRTSFVEENPMSLV